jgi:primosomal replication protein N
MNSKFALIFTMSMIIFAITTIFRPVETIYADTLRSALRQKIGNYDVQLSTAPVNPIAGKEAIIMIKISSTSDDFPITDIPLVIRVSRDNVELTRTDPIFISGGHYKYSYIFKTPGVYGFDLDLLNNSLAIDSQTNQQATFQFPIQVSDFSTLSLTSILGTFVLLIVILGMGFFAIKKYRHKLCRLKNTSTRKTSSE